MQTIEAAAVQKHPTRLELFMALADKAAAISPDMGEPETVHDSHSEKIFVTATDQRSGNKTQVQSSGCQFSVLDRAAQKDTACLNRQQLIQKYGHDIADKAIAAAESQVPTARHAYSTYQQQEREAKRELGRSLAAAGVLVQRHSVLDYARVIVTQLDLLQDGGSPSISAVVKAAFPDDPKKAKSLSNSRNGKRRKQAYNSDTVRNHPMEDAMQAIHGRGIMNRRLTAGTFGQSLAINHALFGSCNRITKLEARVKLLEQQMQSTKQREALADSGCNTSREKVLALYSEGKRQTEIAELLGMKLDAVKYHLRKRPKDQ